MPSSEKRAGMAHQYLPLATYTAPRLACCVLGIALRCIALPSHCIGAWACNSALWVFLGFSRHCGAQHCNAKIPLGISPSEIISTGGSWKVEMQHVALRCEPKSKTQPPSPPKPYKQQLASVLLSRLGDVQGAGAVADWSICAERQR